jgi:ASCH domain
LADQELGGEVKALTVKQPWAWLIMAGLKDVENRARPTKYRGKIAIHVSLKPSEAWSERSAIGIAHLDCADREVAELVLGENTHAGHVIGTVELVDCVQDHDSPWAFADHWHWVLRNPFPFIEPIPAKGRLGLWEWDER